MLRLISMISLLVAVGMGSACSKNSKQDATAPGSPSATGERPELEREEPLPEVARDLLRTYMVEHGDNMETLLWSALMLDHQATEIVAQRILAQPRMSRPTPAAGETLNDWLPERFFELQDQMYDAAEELRKAAAAGDDMGTARAYARLAETCVTCHSLYLTLPAEAGAEGE